MHVAGRGEEMEEAVAKMESSLRKMNLGPSKVTGIYL